jgi:hypothetical protein
MTSSARARANHKLYLARILLNAWQEALDGEDVPAITLTQAFFGPVREHLIGAYGWFLLELCHLDELQQRPPRSCAELPELPPGRAVPGEIQEFRRLEDAGWLAGLLEERDDLSRVSRRAVQGGVNLAATAGELPGPAELSSWSDQLEALFDRMGNSLDEC